MAHTKRFLVLLLLASTMLGAIGQLLFKIGVKSSFYGMLEFIILGMAVYFVSSLIYLYVIGRTHLSWAYGLGGLSYIFASVMAFAFLNEAVPTLRWYGILIITLGTVLIGLS